MTSRLITTLFEHVPEEDLGFTLAHEHLACAFSSSGDPDLQFTDIDAVLVDLEQAVGAGVQALVEMSTYDMRPRLDLIRRLARETGVRVVKSTGWRKSPAIEAEVAGRTCDELAERLVEDLTGGFKTGGRAGLIGEIGMSGPRGTRAERTVLAAVAVAAVETGAAVSLHTEGMPNAVAMVEQLVNDGIEPARILVGHVRAGDALLEQRELAQAGVLLGFDQLGHPRYDPAQAVARRILRLAEDGLADRIVLSADVGRLSRLTAYGGSGYISGVRDVCSVLIAEEGGKQMIGQLTGGNIARLLALPESPAFKASATPTQRLRD